MDFLDEYINNHLSPRLSSYGLEKNIVLVISEDIKNRLKAILNCWNAPPLRHLFLFTGIEEASFYSPQANLDIKSLVVLGVRNSLLEDIASTTQAARQFDLKKKIIPDEHIILFTGDAIKYFKEIHLEKLAQTIQSVAVNPYIQLKDKYPFAWAAFEALTKSTGKENHFLPIKETNTINYLPPITSLSSTQSTNTSNVTVMSGMSPIFDTNLLQNLHAIADRHINLFFADSFKMISRNPDKLFKVIDFVLRHNSSFVSCNYFLSNGYVSRRRNLQKPAHLVSEIRYKLHDTDGLSQKHRTALKNIKSSF